MRFTLVLPSASLRLNEGQVTPFAGSAAGPSSRGGAPLDMYTAATLLGDPSLGRACTTRASGYRS